MEDIGSEEEIAYKKSLGQMNKYPSEDHDELPTSHDHELENTEKAGQQQHTGARDDSSARSNLIINYLPHDIGDAALKSLFHEFGEIITTKVVRDKNTKKSLGFGFVKFLKEEDAERAISRMNGLTLGNKHLKVSVARPPSLDIRNCKLYVTNLPKDYTEKDVIDLFQEFGEIIECRLLKDKNARNTNKGVAFVQYNLKQQAEKALILNGCQFEGSTKGLTVKYAEDQHRKKELNRLHNLTSSSPRNIIMDNNMNSSKLHVDVNEPDGLAEAYYYPAQNMNPGPFVAPGSPLHQRLAHHLPHSPLGAMYMQPPGPHPSMLDYANKRGGNTIQKLPFPLDNDPIDMRNANSWYNAISPQHLSYLQSQSDNQGLIHTMDLGLSPPGSPLHVPPNLRHLSLHHKVNGRHSPPDSSNTHSELQMEETSLAQSHRQATLHTEQDEAVSIEIRNLPAHANAELLRSLFSPYGIVLSTHLDMVPLVPGTATKVCSGRGILKLGGYNQAKVAVTQLHNAVIVEDCAPIHVSISM